MLLVLLLNFGQVVIFACFVKQVSDRRVKKIIEMDSNAHISSENALLSEKSFLTDQKIQSVPNGYHLEWITKKPKSTFPTYKESPKMVRKLVLWRSPGYS